MSDVTSREVLLKSRPQGVPQKDNFEIVERRIGDPKPGEVLIRNVYMSVDPYMRGRMNDVKSYVPPFALGETLTGGAVGRIEKSNNPGFREGDHVTHNFGWREYALSDGAGLEKVDAHEAPLSHYLGVLGMPGLTAYVGLLRLAELKAGEVVFVSGAAGIVGSVAGQIAKAVDCPVIGSAGSDEKVAHLTSELGFDAAFNYREQDPGDALAEWVPDGIDVYFENVGGRHLEAALDHLKINGRIAACGMISQYNNIAPEPGPRNLMNIVRNRLTIRGFIVSDHADMRNDFRRDMARWIREGKVKTRETVLDGIEQAPSAFIGLFEGRNEGKMLVRLADVG